MKAKIKINTTINLEFTEKEQEAIETVVDLLDTIDDLINNNSSLYVDDNGILIDSDSQYSTSITHEEIVNLFNKLSDLKEMRVPKIIIASTEKEDE